MYKVFDSKELTTKGKKDIDRQSQKYTETPGKVKKDSKIKGKRTNHP